MDKPMPVIGKVFKFDDYWVVCIMHDFQKTEALFKFFKTQDEAYDFVYSNYNG